jgi:hypothetical protein
MRSWKSLFFISIVLTNNVQVVGSSIATSIVTTDEPRRQNGNMLAEETDNGDLHLYYQTANLDKSYIIPNRLVIGTNQPSP